MTTATVPAEPSAELNGLGEFITGVLADWQVPGAAVAVAKDGQIVFMQGFGRRNLAEDLPVTTDTVFAIASCSKAFGMTTLAILADEGKVDWDTPVRTYLPDFALSDPFASEHLTLRDIATHRSGLPRHDALWYGATFSRADYFRRLRYLEFSEPFRTTFQYNNMLYTAAGYVAGKIEDCEWEEVAQRRILDPLGLNDTNFSVTRSQLMPDHALPYRVKEGQPVATPFQNIDFAGSAGCINSTVADMSRWLLLNMGQGELDGRRLVSAEQLRQLHTPQMFTPASGKYDEIAFEAYGMGWGVNAYRGHVQVSHRGGIDGFSSIVSFLPRHGIGVVVLANADGSQVPPIIAYAVHDRLLGLPPVAWNERFRHERDGAPASDLTPPEPDAPVPAASDTVPSHDLIDYTGRYAHPAYGRLVIEEQGGALAVHFNAMTGPLEHRHHDVFEYDFEALGERVPLAFETDLAGDVSAVALPLEPLVRPIVFVLQPPPELVDTDFLRTLTGTYDFKGAPAVVTLRDATTLQLALPGTAAADLIPRRGTAFWLRYRGGDQIEFQRDDAGAVTGATLRSAAGVVTMPRRQPAPANSGRP